MNSTKRLAVLLALVLIFGLFGCTPEPDASDNAAQDAATPNTEGGFSLSSSGIQNGEIAAEFGSRGSQVENGVPTRSLAVSIQNAPEGTACFALVMTDPDAVAVAGYEWTHWLAVFEQAELAENASLDSAATLLQGENDFGTLGYGGPAPPKKTHTYVITLYALDAAPELEPGYSLDELLAAIDGHVLAEATLRGSYAR